MEIKKNFETNIDSKFFQAFLEALEHDDFLFDYCKSDKAFTIVLQVIDSLLKYST